jgi:threonine aldolase
MLAGPRTIIDGMYHTRRMFGGGLSSVWPFAAVALHYAAGFGDRFSQAVRTSEEMIRGLRQHGAFAIDRVPSGTNLFRLQLRGTDPVAFQQRLARAGVIIASPQHDVFLVGVNETLNRSTPAALTDAFVRALAG